MYFDWEDTIAPNEEYLLVVDYTLTKGSRDVYAFDVSYAYLSLAKQGVYRWWVIAVPRGRRNGLDSFLTVDKAWLFTALNR